MTFRPELEKLKLLLDSLVQQVNGVVVVDNGSIDGTPEVVEQAGARVVRMGSNTGFARAVNRGIAECRTE